MIAESAPHELTLEVVEWMRDNAHRSLAWQAHTIAVRFGVTTRTAYRWLATVTAIEEVEIDGWRATFARRTGQPPLRVTPWVRGGAGSLSRAYRFRLKQAVNARRENVARRRHETSDTK